MLLLACSALPWCSSPDARAVLIPAGHSEDAPVTTSSAARASITGHGGSSGEASCGAQQAQDEEAG